MASKTDMWFAALGTLAGAVDLFTQIDGETDNDDIREDAKLLSSGQREVMDRNVADLLNPFAGLEGVRLTLQDLQD